MKARWTENGGTRFCGGGIWFWRNMVTGKILSTRRFSSVTRSEVRSCCGIITPFADQKEYIGQLLIENSLNYATCSIVHAFQGDEKGVILFPWRWDQVLHFVIYEHQYGGRQMPILGVELDGKEHMTQEAVRKRNEQ